MLCLIEIEGEEKEKRKNREYTRSFILFDTVQIEREGKRVSISHHFISLLDRQDFQHLYIFHMK